MQRNISSEVDTSLTLISSSYPNPKVMPTNKQKVHILMFGRSKRTTQQQKRNEETYEDAIRDFKKKKVSLLPILSFWTIY